eukprot:4554530-Amphidinium_carterae.1
MILCIPPTEDWGIQLRVKKSDNKGGTRVLVCPNAKCCGRGCAAAHSRGNKHIQINLGAPTHEAKTCCKSCTLVSNFVCTALPGEEKKLTKPMSTSAALHPLALPKRA